jgi:uncharacterized phiE125 gp8 family phage protein
MLTLRVSSEQQPLTITEVKAHLRLDSDEENDLLQSLVMIATDMVESYLGMTLIEKTWTWTHAPLADGAEGQSNGEVVIVLPMGPLVDVISVTRLQPNGNRLPLSRYHVDRYARRPKVRCFSNQPVEVLFSCGFGTLPRHIPPILRHGMMTLVAHFYENRTGEFEIPKIVKALLQPYRNISIA